MNTISLPHPPYISFLRLICPPPTPHPSASSSLHLIHLPPIPHFSASSSLYLIPPPHPPYTSFLRLILPIPHYSASSLHLQCLILIPYPYTSFLCLIPAPPMHHFYASSSIQAPHLVALPHSIPDQRLIL